VHGAMRNTPGKRDNRIRRLLATATTAVALVATVSACGNAVAEAEESATVYFTAVSTTEWGAAAEAGTRIARSRAMYYEYLQQVPDLPSGALFRSSAEAAAETSPGDQAQDSPGVVAEFESLTEVDGQLRATGVLTGTRDLDTVVFMKTDSGVKVADFAVGPNPDGTPLMMSQLWQAGGSEDTQGVVSLRTIAGRMARSGDVIRYYQWLAVVQNAGAQPIDVTSVVFTPAGGQPVTGTPNAGDDSPRNQTLIRTVTQIPAGRAAGVWVSQPATVPEGFGTLSVTWSADGNTDSLTVDLPVLVPPPGWPTQ